VRHEKQELIYHGSPVAIDKVMVPAIQALWGCGIETDECCQGNPPKDGKTNAYIVFRDSTSARKFHALMENSADYLSLLRGVWSLQPKSGSRLLLVLDWCPTKTQQLVKMVKKVCAPT
jgi:hypothetical protein